MNQPTPTCLLPRIEDAARECTRGVGRLSVVREGKPAPLPLAGVSISARVADRVALVTLTETFHNPYAEPLEAVYIFPLAGGSAVSDFEMRVGARVIKGKVEERGEARRQYRQALQAGKRAALLEQERDDVFTVQVGNLPPGEEVSVTLVYSERLPFFEDGATELRLPLVVAPRYIPGSPLARDPVGTGTEFDTDVVPDASRITPPRLVPGFDPKVALSLHVELLRGAGDGDFADLACSQHATRTTLAMGAVTVALSRTDEPLNRDFVLRWRLATERIRSRLLVHRDATGAAYGMLSVVPPRRDGFLGLARDVVFVLDRSGSMGGVKMTSAARACSLLLSTLGPRDRFAIEAFDDRVEWFVPPGAGAKGERYFQPADEAGIGRGDRFLRGVDARGGTELDGALAEALELIRLRAPAAGRVPVVVLLTDGQIGDEGRVLKRIQTALGDARVFTVGIDTAVNDGFLRRLAALGGGTSTFVEPGAALEEALRSVGREIGAPVIVDLSIQDAGAEGEWTAIAPARLPDLFAGRGVNAFFPLRGRGGVRVVGRFAEGGSYEETVPAEEISLPAIAHLWARTRVADLEDRFRLEPGAQAQIRQEIVQLAVRHTLLTRFTAFVVVDESEIVNQGGNLRQVTQPVEEPAQWELSRQQAAVGRRGGYSPSPAPPAPTSTGAVSFDAKLEADEQAMIFSDAEDGAPSGAPMPPAPAKPMAPPPSRSALGAMFGKLSSSDKENRAREPKPGPVVPEAERAAIRAALEAFGKALADARRELEAGRLPRADVLEKARAALLAALAASVLGMELPLLQRFLRSAAVEIVAALGASGASPVAALALFRRHEPALAAASTETGARLTGTTGAADAGAFWEGSV